MRLQNAEGKQTLICQDRITETLYLLLHLIIRNSMHRFYQKKFLHSFYFVRHGQTDWEPEDILKGPQDLRLNVIGQEQAKLASLVLKQLLIDSPNAKIVSSSLLRAVETANEIEKATGIPISAEEDGLRERYYGDYRLVRNNLKSPSDAESSEEFRKRVDQTLDRIFLEYYQANPLIIVSHQKVFEYLAESLSNYHQSLSQGGIARFIRHENGTWGLHILEITENAENPHYASKI